MFKFLISFIWCIQYFYCYCLQAIEPYFKVLPFLISALLLDLLQLCILIRFLPTHYWFWWLFLYCARFPFWIRIMYERWSFAFLGDLFPTHDIYFHLILSLSPGLISFSYNLWLFFIIFNIVFLVYLANFSLQKDYFLNLKFFSSLP